MKDIGEKMYKVKIVFLYKDSVGKCTWSHQWADWNGIDEISSIIVEYRGKEEKALKDDNMDQVVTHALAVEFNDITDGELHCKSCECYFNHPDGGGCPYCGKVNWYRHRYP